MIRGFGWMGFALLAFFISVFTGPLQAADTPNQSTVSSSGLDVSASNEGPFPKIFAPVVKYQFEPVLDGVPVLYDYVIKNNGNAELVIKKVEAG